MDQITLGEVAAAVTLIGGLITGVSVLMQTTKKWIKESLEDQLNTITERLDQVDMESCKNYLVSYLSDVEHGKDPGELEKQRFYEEYQHYQKIGGNSYIKHKVDELQAKGLL